MMSREQQQQQFLKGRTIAQLESLRRIAERFASEPLMPDAGKHSARQKIEDIDAEIARMEQQKPC